MDPFELLKADHKKVAELFDVLEAASGKRKLDVFKSIKSELELHAHIEEAILYPALEKPEETHDLTLEAYEEHNVVKTLLAELSGARSATDEWQAKAKVLRENVEHHVDEEENELFDKADDALSDEEIAALGQRLVAEKARKQGKPVPEKTEAETGKKETSKKKTAKPGIISRIANFVGLGDNGANKKAPKKKAAKKATVKKKTTAARSSSKARKPSSQTARKRASATIGSKRASVSKSGSRKQSAARSGTKAAKKRISRK